jgi:hypothetical protein
MAVLGSVALGASLPRDYEILSRKSIFARDRVARVAGSERVSYQRAPRGSAQPVLVGILREDAGFAASLEFPGTGKQMLVHVGEALPDNMGTITNITLDYMEYVAAAGQAPTRIPVGRNLEGAEAPIAAGTVQPATQPSTPSSVQPTTGEAAPAGDGEDLLTRMRRRRQQELNR